MPEEALAHIVAARRLVTNLATSPCKGLRENLSEPFAW